MTITVKYKTDRVRYQPKVLFNTDVDDVGDITFDYSGHLGGDTIDTATVTANDITAGSPTISSNIVTVPLSGGKAGIAKMELKITTTGGSTLSSLVRFRIKDYYGDA